MEFDPVVAAIRELTAEVCGLRDDVARLEDRPKSWVRARAYADGEFVLGVLLDQMDADLEEANDLPLSTRSYIEFKMEREERRGRKSAVVAMKFNDSDTAQIVRLGAIENTVVAVLFQRHGQSRRLRITAEWDTDSENVQWLIAEEESSRVVAEMRDVSRAILEPVLFPA